MAATFTIWFHSTEVAASADVSICFPPGWGNDARGCRYDPAADTWSITLPTAAFPNGITFKFRCRGRFQLRDEPLVIAPADYASREKCTFSNLSDPAVRFESRSRPALDQTEFARTVFPPSTDEHKLWDYIVVGSGAGGGAVAYDLATDLKVEADKRPQVLVLEAGSYLFPTHVGNLPRRHRVDLAGGVDKSIWDLWEQYSIENYVVAPGSDEASVAIAQGINLGGRTIFWGGLAPVVFYWEWGDDAATDGSGWWDPVVREDLRTRWVPRANQFMRVGSVPSSAYQEAVKRVLFKVLPDLSHIDAPMAVEYAGYATSAVPRGIFSTAELLVEAQLQTPRYDNLTVNLNHEVIELRPDSQHPSRITEVVAYDRVARTPRTFRLGPGGRVILAAGTIGTAALALRAGLGRSNHLVGKGLTDHSICFLKFRIKHGPFASAVDSSKTLSRHPRVHTSISMEDELQNFKFNMVLELGANLNQSRFASQAEFEAVSNQRDEGLACELVFLFAATRLDPAGMLEIGPPPDYLPRISVSRAPVPEPMVDVVTSTAVSVLEGVGGSFEGMKSGAAITSRLVRRHLEWGRVGAVAHEVGTMRLGADSRTSVVDQDLRIHDRENVYVCDLSVFPTAPAANPTLTLTALALRLADHLRRGASA